MHLDEDYVRQRAHRALTFALEHDFSNDIVRPLLAATRGEMPTRLITQLDGCLCCGNLHPQRVLVVEDQAEVSRWVRPDDERLRHELERVTFETMLKAHLRGAL